MNLRLPYLISSSLLLGISSVGAAVVVSYDSGIAASSGVSGAADPASQGWTLTNAAGNQFSDGYDSGNGGWRTVDGTGVGPANYSIGLSGPQQTSLTTQPGWEITWTLALDEDAIGSAGATVADYYVSPNNFRQTNLVTLIDLAADGLGYFITHEVNASNEVLLNTNTGPGGTFNTGVVVNSTFPNFATFTLTHDNATGDAILDYGAGTATITPGGPLVAGRDAVFFGAGDSAGQGSAVWNEFSLETVPEPGYATILGIAGLGILLRRRQG